MLGVAQNLEGTAEIQGIHAFVEGEKNVDGFMGVAALRNCTHLADLMLGMFRKVYWVFVKWRGMWLLDSQQD